MSDIKLGIIGAGSIAVEHLKVIRDIDGLQVVGITSRTRAKAETLAAEFNIPSICDSIEALVERCHLDAMMILVSAEQVFKVSQVAVLFRIPLFIEKPPGLVPEETRMLAELAKKYSVANMVGYNRRYYSVFHKGMDVIKEHGKLLGIAVEGHERFWNIAGKVNKTLQSNWIYANSTHTIDLLRLFGGDIHNISAVQNSCKEKNGDQFSAVMEFENGALGNYIAHWYSPGGWSVKLFGEGVTVEFRPLERGVWMDTSFKENEINPDDVDLKYKPGFFRQMQTFAHMVKTGELSWPGMDLEASLLTMEMAQKISGR
ncbi:MAG: Gfo/Idh/MocA family oxidoreductase [Proteobacteria bacterium]|nr:Gfo/Idh/MocA family oxidoreductase [Pseudomonadota bacterium]MBU1389481.1 Gfo/Idh/MocA family oxidoreductase [Pseudomonadota bacterium]MBU1541301.1 Gfo/Idh/MocA family oxidoreductase [Pseudomonadota bacterium]MBU2429836.1 Gfo/Idh/MocA family oxidoreductase [Pseudomonadota bacterium]